MINRGFNPLSLDYAFGQTEYHITRQRWRRRPTRSCMQKNQKVNVENTLEACGILKAPTYFFKAATSPEIRCLIAKYKAINRQLVKVPNITRKYKKNLIGRNNWLHGVKVHAGTDGRTREMWYTKKYHWFTVRPLKIGEYRFEMALPDKTELKPLAKIHRIHDNIVFFSSTRSDYVYKSFSFIPHTHILGDYTGFGLPAKRPPT